MADFTARGKSFLSFGFPRQMRERDPQVQQSNMGEWILSTIFVEEKREGAPDLSSLDTCHKERVFLSLTFHPEAKKEDMWISLFSQILVERGVEWLVGRMTAH